MSRDLVPASGAGTEQGRPSQVNGAPAASWTRGSLPVLGAWAPRTLHGRSAELGRALTELRRVAKARRAGMLVLSAASGLGLTATLLHVAEHARRLGYAVGIGGAPDPRPLWMEHRPGDNDLVPNLAPLMTALRASSSPLVSDQEFLELGDLHDRPLWFIDHLGKVLAKRAEASPLLIAIDDLQWADPATVHALRVLPERLAASPVLWALSGRVGEGPLDEIQRTSAHVMPQTRMDLAPLAVPAVEALALELLGEAPSPGLAGLLQGAGGFPGLAVPLIKEVLADRRGRPDQAATTLAGKGLPPAFVGCLCNRLQADLPVAALELLHVGAVLGDFTLDDVAAVASRPAREMLAPLEQLVHRGYLVDDGRRITFALPLVRLALYDSIPASARALMHRIAADHLEASHRLASEVAPHLAATARVGEAHTIEVLRSAAQEQRAQDPDGSARSLRRARALVDGAQALHVDVTCELVDVLVSAGRHSEAARESDAEPDPDQAARARLVVAVAPAWWALGRFRDLAEAAELALPADSRPPESARLGAIWRAADVAAGGTVAHVDPASISSPGTADDVVRQWQLRRAAVVAAEAGRHAVAAARFRELNAITGAFVLEEIESLLRSDDLDGASTRLTACSTQAPHPGSSMGLDLAQALVHEARGRLRDAADSAALAVARAVREEQPVLHALGAAVLGQVALLRDQLQNAAARVSEAEHLVTTPTARARLTVLAAELLAAQDSPRAAARHLLAHVDAVAADTRQQPEEHVLDAVRLASAGGHPELASHLAGWISAHAEGSAVARAISAQAAGLAFADVDSLRVAVSGLAGCSRPLLQARAAEDLAAALIVAGDRADAVLQLDRAWHLYSQVEATGRAALVQRALRTSGIRRKRSVREAARPTTGWASLTAREQRVAELIAEGCSNRQAADQLVVSPNTVATHLRSIYSKLDVASRVQLTLVCLERSAPVPAG